MAELDALEADMGAEEAVKGATPSYLQARGGQVGAGRGVEGAG